MLAHLPPKERYGIYGIVVLFMLGVGTVGARYAQRPTPIVFQEQKDEPELRENKPSTVLVDVTGAVKKPLVASLSSESRVKDAIEAAGGALPDADLLHLNLAAKVADGTQIYVPYKDPGKNRSEVAESYKGGPDAPTSYSTKPESPKTGTKSSGAKQPAGKVNLNTATSSQLQSLPGVGPATAEKILEYRHSHGGFSSVDELMAVKGIGPKKLAAMRKWLTL